VRTVGRKQRCRHVGDKDVAVDAQMALAMVHDRADRHAATLRRLRAHSALTLSMSSSRGGGDLDMPGMRFRMNKMTRTTLSHPLVSTRHESRLGSVRGNTTEGRLPSVLERNVDVENVRCAQEWSRQDLRRKRERQRALLRASRYM